MRSCRVEAQRRIVALAGDLDGWTADRDEWSSSETPLWLVTPPLDDEITFGKVVVIGIEPIEADGAIEPTSIGRSAQSEDQWQIVGGILTFGETATPPDDSDWPLAWRAMQAVQDAKDDLAEMFAANHRLAIEGEPFIGIHDVRIVRFLGPVFTQSEGGDPCGVGRFTIDARADLALGSNPNT